MVVSKAQFNNVVLQFPDVERLRSQKLVQSSLSPNSGTIERDKQTVTRTDEPPHGTLGKRETNTAELIVNPNGTATEESGGKKSRQPQITAAIWHEESARREESMRDKRVRRFIGEKSERAVALVHHGKEPPRGSLTGAQMIQMARSMGPIRV